MNKMFKFFLIMLLIFMGSVFLTPLVSLMLPMFRFEKIFSRLMMIFAFVAAFIYVLYQRRKEGAQFSRDFWPQTGFDFSAPWKKLFFYGFLCGCLSVAFITVSEVVLGPRYFRNPVLIQDVVERFGKGLFSGITVGIVEEFFFRGFIFGYLRKHMHIIFAILASSAFYALTHFLNNGQIFIPSHPSIKDSFRLLFGYLEPFAYRWNETFPQFFGLFIFGVVLCLAYIRTNSLFLSIGIHAGAVFSIKFQYSFIRKPIEDLNYPFFGKSLDYDGPFEWIVLLLLGIILWFIILPSLQVPGSANHKKISKNPLR